VTAAGPAAGPAGGSGGGRGGRAQRLGGAGRPGAAAAGAQRRPGGDAGGRGRADHEAASGGGGILSQYLGAVICGAELGAKICGVELFFSATYDATSEARQKPRWGSEGVGQGPRRRDLWRRGAKPRRHGAWRRPSGSKTEIKFSRGPKSIFFKKRAKL